MHRVERLMPSSGAVPCTFCEPGAAVKPIRDLQEKIAITWRTKLLRGLHSTIIRLLGAKQYSVSQLLRGTKL